MPTFVDRHPLTTVPSTVRLQMHRESLHGLLDPSGTRPLSHWIQDGVIHCVLMAPSQDAVCQHHAKRGLPCDDLHVLEGGSGNWPPSPAEQEVVRAAIGRLWPMTEVRV